jgi:pyruvate formate lyase activating enzyme
MDGSSKISKREFLKASLCGVCGVALGSVDAFAGGVLKMDAARPLPPEKLWKWSKEAYHYIQTPKGMRCLICPNECDITPEEPSDCRTRISVDNKLYTIAYGNPCAVHVDPIEKKPLYHFLPSSSAFSIATAGCNLACLNCQNWSISQADPRDTRNYDLMPKAVVEECKKNGCKSIAYTYSDPVAFYEYAYDTAAIAREHGIKNVVVTAGYINEKPLKQFCEVIDAANVDLKSFSEEIYMMLNAGKLEPVLNTLKTMKDAGVWLEITNLVVPSWTDDFDMIEEMCRWLYQNGFEGYPLHFSRFTPQYKLTNLPSTPESTLNKARDIALNQGLKFVYIGNVPGTEAVNTYCPGCDKILIERRGFSIIQNNINDNKCKSCGEVIPGVWK